MKNPLKIDRFLESSSANLRRKPAKWRHWGWLWISTRRSCSAQPESVLRDDQPPAAADALQRTAAQLRDAPWQWLRICWTQHVSRSCCRTGSPLGLARRGEDKCHRKRGHTTSSAWLPAHTGPVGSHAGPARGPQAKEAFLFLDYSRRTSFTRI